MNNEQGKNEGEWYYRDGLAVEGPFSVKELKACYVAREIEADTEVWSATITEWQPLSSQSFFGEIPSLPAISGQWRSDELFSRHRWQVLIGGFVSALALLVALIYLFNWQHSLSYPQWLFIVYTTGFGSMWFIYFMSRQGPGLFQVLTLRSLLRKTAANWSDASNVRKSEIEKAFQEKARASMTATTMLAATAGLALGQVNSIINSLGDRAGEASMWQMSMLGLAALFAFSALICFIIAVDALDSMFNKFESRRVARELHNYFYMESINPRYFGLLSLFSAAIFVVASNDALLGCAAIGVLISIGFRHWFPQVRLPDDPKPCEPQQLDASAKERWRLWRLTGEVAKFLLRLGVLAGFPLLLRISGSPWIGWV